MRHALLLALAVLATAGEAVAPVGFRGDGAGRYPDATPPLEWGAAKNVAWKAALPSWSNATPLPLGELIVTCSEPASVVGVDAASGTIRWTVDDEAPAAPPKVHKVNGFTSASPASDGQRIVTVFSTGRALACDLSGKKLWAVDLELPPHKEWGSCMSPRFAGGVVVVHIDHLWGLDPATGAVKWKVKTPWTWGTPVIARVGGTDVVWTGGGAAFNAADGKPLGSGPPKLAYNSPVLADGVLYCIQDVPMAFRLGAAPGAAPQRLWQGGINKDRYYASPLIHEGLIYDVNRKGVLSVIDAADGKTVYEQKLEGFKDPNFYPSPTLGGKHVFISSGGITAVLKPGRAYEEVARNTLEDFRGCPVFVGKRVFIRGRSALWCFAVP